jgi:hypothetical protein
VQEEETAAGQGFAGGADRRMRDATVPPQQWIRMYLRLDLSEDQRSQAGAVLEEFRQKTAAFEEEHAADLAAIREATRRRELSPELRQKAQRLNSARPLPEAYQQRLWDLLNQTQQEEMKAALAQARERMAENRARRLAGAEGGMTEDGMRPGEGEAARPADGAPFELDEAGRRRLRFLQSRQSRHRPGAPPSEDDMRFRFEEPRTARDQPD